MQKDTDIIIGRWDRNRTDALASFIKEGPKSRRASTWSASTNARSGEVGMLLEIARMGPGMSFGDTAVLAGGVRRATVLANTHVEVLVLSRADLLANMPPDTKRDMIERAQVKEWSSDLP